MKGARLLARLAVLALAVVVFIGLIQMYAGSMRPPFGNARRQLARRNRPSEPQAGRLPSFVGEILLLALIAVAGRIVFRLRLSAAPRSDEHVILLELDQAPQHGPDMRDS